MIFFMKRAQAAMEFLTTYGWAFLVLLASIGGLSYLGVFNVTNFVPDACSLGSSITCPIFLVEKDATDLAVNLQLLNGQDRIEIVGMGLKDNKLTEYCLAYDLTDTAGVTLATVPSRSISSTERKEYVFEFQQGQNGCNFVDSFVESTRKRNFDVRLYYISKDATQQVSVEGNIIATTQPYVP